MRKLPPDKNQTRIFTWNPNEPIEKFSVVVASNKSTINQQELTASGWHLESSGNLNLLEKLRKAGKPLGEYVGDKFYRGVTTGFNEAFVVDQTTRDRLVAEHSSSAEVLKPFLRGRDIKRWVVVSQNLWLIFTRRGVDLTKYPAIENYLNQYKKQLMPGVEGGRKPGSYEWYEIQDNIAYWHEFEQPKIILGRFMNKATFAFDKNGYFHNDALYMITGGSEYVVGVLNSSVSWWFLSQICTDLQNGYLQAFRENLFQIPIPVNPKPEAIEALVNKILAIKSKDPKADVSKLERQIDQLVYQLYHLTPEEIKIIENQTGG